jgi:uncharacterized damage-inducible protein DinB
MTADGISFEELLRYNELETTKWKHWFAAHPEAFNHPCDIAKAGTVGALMNHMFVAELFFATQLLGLPARDWQAIHPESMDEVFALHEEAYAKFAEFLAKGSEAADWNTVQDLGFGDVKASKRKMMAQAMLHSISHRSQLAVFLRQAGFEGLWMHDLILTDVMA